MERWNNNKLLKRYSTKANNRGFNFQILCIDRIDILISTCLPKSFRAPYFFLEGGEERKTATFERRRIIYKLKWSSQLQFRLNNYIYIYNDG